MEWLQALFQNTPAIIRAAAETEQGIVALSSLVIGAAGIIYMARTQGTSPWIGFGVFVMLVFGALSLSLVSLYRGAQRPLDLAQAHMITFKTPYYNESNGTYRLLDATVVRIGPSEWRELQERPDGRAEYYHVMKAVEPGRLLFGRRANPDGTADTTELIVNLRERILCYRKSASDPAMECPYALVAVE